MKRLFNQRVSRISAYLTMLAASALLFATAPRQGDFWWSDAPRHALNGVFLRDLLMAMPLNDLRHWAIDYYLHYPALTILFYPPLLAVAEMVSYLLFGVSQTAALIPILLFHAALTLGTFTLARRWLPHWQAWSAAVALAGLPEVALWARQVMTDIPAFALLVWSSVFLLAYCDTARPRNLYTSAALFVLGLYTKQSVIFLVPVALALLWHHRGFAMLRDRHVQMAAAITVLSLLPLLAMTIKFGQANVQSVVAIADSSASRSSISGWFYYLRAMPHQAGWCIVLLAASYVAMAIARANWRLPTEARLLLFGWLVTGYLFFSTIELKDPRLDIFILLPVVLFAVLAINKAVPGHLADFAAVALALASFAYTFVYAPVPQIKGYWDAAAWVESHTPANAIVMFSGKRDGSFIFDLRALDLERRHTIVRADKLLLTISIRRGLGVVEKVADQQAIIAMLRRYGVTYVVAERDFWIDLKPMAALQHALDSPAFAEVKRIEITATIPHDDRELRIYRSALPPPSHVEPLTVDLPIIGQRFQGDATGPGLGREGESTVQPGH